MSKLLALKSDSKDSDRKEAKNEKENNILEIRNSTFLAWNKKVPNTELDMFKDVIEKKYNLHFDTYWDFHSWSIKNMENFWDEVWHYFETISSTPYDKVFLKTGPGFLDNVWFRGASLNFAENMMKIRDNTTAISYADVDGNFENVTFSEMFDEVSLYAAAFRKNGLQKGDRVASYMSNRKEAVFAMLAAVSIGAIWSGAHPFYGARATARILKRIQPKFVITVDQFPYIEGNRDLISRLSDVTDGILTIEKVIIVVTNNETYSVDITRIRNSCFLREFLKTGKTPDGRVPEIVFEQVSADYPVFLNFTSGTTGVPKGLVHSAKFILVWQVQHTFHWNLKKGDTLFSHYQMGWIIWLMSVSCLILGVRLFLFEGDPLHKKEENNYWDIIAKHNVTCLIVVPSHPERAEKYGVLPTGKYDFKNLKLVAVGGSPVNKQNIEFFRKYFSKDVLVANTYGSTENVGCGTGMVWNQPYYAPEAQVPLLGVDVQCFDSEGKSVIGKRGVVVFATPSPSLPVCLWQDNGNVLLNENYLLKYPGVWCQNDECWINPETRGMLLLGRNDDTIIQNGERFLPADIYFAIQGMKELEDYICVSQKSHDGSDRAVLFVKLKEGYVFTQHLKQKIEKTVEEELWLDLIPEVILPVTDIPYNLNGKKMESLVKKIVATNTIPDTSNIKNPECVKQFCDIPEILIYN